MKSIINNLVVFLGIIFLTPFLYFLFIATFLTLDLKYIDFGVMVSDAFFDYFQKQSNKYGEKESCA
jgi:hypothetical protein